MLSLLSFTIAIPPAAAPAVQIAEVMRAWAQHFTPVPFGPPWRVTITRLSPDVLGEDELRAALADVSLAIEAQAHLARIPRDDVHIVYAQAEGLHVVGIRVDLAPGGAP